MNTDRSHDEAIIAMLRRDPALAENYLAAALSEVDPLVKTIFRRN